MRVTGQTIIARLIVPCVPVWYGLCSVAETTRQHDSVPTTRTVGMAASLTEERPDERDGLDGFAETHIVRENAALTGRAHTHDALSSIVLRGQHE